MRILYHPKKITTPTSCVEYGLLYNWYAFTDVRKITSSDDWIIPSVDEFEILLDYIDVYDTELSLYPLAGDKLRETGVAYWLPPNNGATNEYSFNSRGAGGRDAFDGTFYDLLGAVDYRVNTFDEFSSLRVSLASGVPEVIINTGWDYKFGGSIRLVKSSTFLSNGESGEYIGNDGHVYRTICIGTQEWLADDLMETQFRNGDIIPWYGANPANYFTNAEWAALTTAGMCAYDNDVANVGCDFQFPTVEYADVNYGYLYNWYAAMGDADGSGSSETSIAAVGWHLPAYTECDALVAYLGGITVAGGALKETGFTHWDSPNTGATNSSGFTSRGEGFRAITGLYSQIKATSQILTTFSSSSTTTSVFATGGSTSTNAGTYVSGDKRRSGHAVRLVKDSTTLSDGETGIYIGNDGKIYPTICIGTQEWLATNLAETLYRNGSAITNVTDNATWAALTTGARCAYDNDESNAINP